MEPRKHLWLPAMAAAILAAGLAMPAAYAFNPQPDPPGKLRAGQKTLKAPVITKNRRAIGDPDQIGDPNTKINRRAIGDPGLRPRIPPCDPLGPLCARNPL